MSLVNEHMEVVGKSEFKKMFCLSKFCYLCLTNSRVLTSVEPRSRDMIQLVRKLRACAIDIVHLKNYKLKICKTCADILNVSYEFRRRCLGTNKKLLSYVKKLSNKTACYSESYVILNNNLESNSSEPLEFQNTTPSIEEQTIAPSVDKKITVPSVEKIKSADFNNIINNQPIVKLEKLSENIIEIYTNKSINGDNIIETVLQTNSREKNLEPEPKNNNKVKIIFSEIHPLLKDLYIDSTLTCDNDPNNVIETCMQIKQISNHLSLKEKLLNELKIAEENTCEEYTDLNEEINLEDRQKNSKFEIDIVVNKEEPIEIHIEDDPLYEIPEFQIEETNADNLHDHSYTYCPPVFDHNTSVVQMDHPYCNMRSTEDINNKRKRKSDCKFERKRQKEDFYIMDEEIDFIDDGIVDFS